MTPKTIDGYLIILTGPRAFSRLCGLRLRHSQKSCFVSGETSGTVFGYAKRSAQNTHMGFENQACVRA